MKHFDVTPEIRKALKEFGVPETLGETEIRSRVFELIKDGTLSIERFCELLNEQHKQKKANARKRLKELLADDESGPPVTSDEELAEMERKLIEKIKGPSSPIFNNNKYGDNMSAAEAFNKMAYDASPYADNSSETTHIRVKGAGEAYSTTRYVRKHAKWETPVHPIRNGVVSSSPVESLSEFESAKLGAFLKWKAARAGLCSLTEHDKAVLNECLESDTWVGWTNNELVRQKNVKALIDDSTSGGENLVPEWFDNRIVSFPLLTSELLPFVDIVDVPRSSTVETVSVGNPTLTWNNSEASSQSLFTTTGLVAHITASIFPTAVYIQIGRDLMADSLPNIGDQLMQNTAQRIANELDKVIAAGDGTTQPQGIKNASGTTDITPENPTTGAVTVNDLLDLMFGVGKQYRIPAMNPRYVMSDSRYKSHRALATGVSGDDRLLHGMSVQNYQLLESPVAIENSGLSNSDGIFGALVKYRLWRRAGFETGFETRGDTLVRSNTALFWARGRYGGKVIDGSAFAVCDAWPTSA